MTGTIASRWILKLAAGLLGAGIAVTAGGAEPVPLGVTYDEVVDQPGVLESVGRPLLGGDLVKTLDRGAVVRLNNGRVLRLAANSSALLEPGAAGEVMVTVLSGRVVTIGESDRPLTAGQRSRFVVRPVVQDTEAAEARLLGFDLDSPRGREEQEETPRRDGVTGGALH